VELCVVEEEDIYLAQTV